MSQRRIVATTFLEAKSKQLFSRSGYFPRLLPNCGRHITTPFVPFFTFFVSKTAGFQSTEVASGPNKMHFLSCFSRPIYSGINPLVQTCPDPIPNGRGFSLRQGESREPPSALEPPPCSFPGANIKASFSGLNSHKRFDETISTREMFMAFPLSTLNQHYQPGRERRREEKRLKRSREVS